jgi:hypothetical protein
VALGSYVDREAYPSLPRPCLLVAVESMVHAADASLLLRAAAGFAVTGDRLLVVDDFIAEGTGAASGARARRIVRAARNGWRAPSLQGVRELVGQAGAAGWELERNEDWSAWVPAARWLTLELAGLAAAIDPERLPPVPAGFVGSSALLRGYALGVFSYRFLLFRRTAAPCSLS